MNNGEYFFNTGKGLEWTIKNCPLTCAKGFEDTPEISCLADADVGKCEKKGWAIDNGCVKTCNFKTLGLTPLTHG